MIQVIFESGFTPAVRMFDGCMVEGIFNATPLIKSIENHINSKYDALSIQVVPKPHNTTIELPEDYEIPTAPVSAWDFSLIVTDTIRRFSLFCPSICCVADCARRRRASDV